MYLPGYDIKNQIREGVDSIVFRAERQKDGKPIIIKLMKDAYPTLEQIVNFKREYQILLELQNPGIIEVYDFVRCKNTYAIILEDIGGNSLDSVLKEGKLDLYTFLQIACRMVEILEVVHNN